MTKNRTIKRHILISLAVLLLLPAAVGYSIYRFRQHCVSNDMAVTLNNVKEGFQSELEKEADLLTRLNNLIFENEKLEAAWLGQDRERLLDIAKPIFENLKADFKVTHFYFHDLEGVNFLRAHNPPRHSDVIRRFTMQRAMRADDTASGIELGPLGTFTLRVVTPWRIEEATAGYVELGMEIEHLTDKVKRAARADLIFVVDKDYLQRANWEEGLEMLGRTGDWEQFSEFAVLDNTLGDVPEELARHMRRLESCKGYENLGKRIRISFRDRKYCCGFVCLFDAGDRDVGVIAVMKDVTASMAAARRALATATLCGFGVELVLIGLFWRLLRLMEKRSASQRNELERKIEQQEREMLSLAENESALREQIKAKSEAAANLEKRVSDLTNVQNAAIRSMEEAEKAKAQVERKNNEQLCASIEGGKSDSVEQENPADHGCVEGQIWGRALLAEDNEANQMLIQLLLEKMGLAVTTVCDGVEAVSEATRDSYDIVLMDMQMPNMNGYSATKAIRDADVETPIVAITANAMTGDDLKCLDAGCDAYVAKPVNREKLAEVVMKHICRKSRAIAGKFDYASGEVERLTTICQSGLSGKEISRDGTPLYRETLSSKANCWEVMGCGREEDGERACELGVCPAATETAYDGINGGTNAGRLCWKVAGTMCGGEMQGTYAKKLPTCLNCKFFQQVQAEQSRMFVQ